MQGLARWIAGHFAAAELLAVVLVIGGSVFALKSKDSAFVGWGILAAGVALGFWTLKLSGLI